VAFDSLGVRSMATVIETPDLRVFVDPSAALAPIRFGLPPHEVELRVLSDSASRIASELADVDVVVVTHYHYDHHDPGRLIPADLYSSKVVLVKDPTRSINVSQRIRASRFLRILRGVGARVEVADGAERVFGRTRLVFSKPVQHGNTPRLGYVLAVRVEYGGESVSFSSDVEGPLDGYVVDFMCGSSIAIVDGPPTYLVGRAYSDSDVGLALGNLVRLANCVETLVVDHHLVRDLNYVELFEEIRRSTGRSPKTAAELAGLRPNLLEARRRELYGLPEEE
jgi:predicted metallo-beta-lactamase superfamily hydrolase